MSDSIKPKVPKQPKQAVDWERIEFHFRAGIRSLEDIGKEFGVSKGRISQVGKQKGWGRDLAAKIETRANAKIQAQVAQQALNEAALNDPAKQSSRRLVESEIVDANVDMQVFVRLEHRKDIVRSRELFRSLMEELEVASSKDGQALIETLAELAGAARDDETEEQAEKRRDGIWRQVRKLMDSGARVDSAKKLVEMLEKVIRLEREAFGIDNKDKGDGAFEEVLRSVIAQSGQ